MYSVGATSCLKTRGYHGIIRIIRRRTFGLKMASIGAALLVVVAVALLAPSHSQTIRTINGTLSMEINGATLTLAGTAAPSGPSSGSSLASISDVAAAIQNVIAQTQPQVERN